MLENHPRIYFDLNNIECAIYILVAFTKRAKEQLQEEATFQMVYQYTAQSITCIKIVECCCATVY